MIYERIGILCLFFKEYYIYNMYTFHTLGFIYIDCKYFLDLLVVQQPSVDIGSIQSTGRAIGNYKKPKHIENQKFFQVFLYAAYTPMWPLVSRNYNKKVEHACQCAITIFQLR